MNDPDMGDWYYAYYNNSNLTNQIDNKNQMITLTYDALNRLTARTYPSGSGMTNVGYGYDSGTNGKGQQTSMSDASGANSTTYAFDNRGLEITESRTIDANNYTTQYTYDGADRLSTVTYPTGEVVTQTYNGRGILSRHYVNSRQRLLSLL